MTQDEYVTSVLAKYEVPRGPSAPTEVAASAIAPKLRAWAGSYLSDLTYSGSYMKETGVHGLTDVDLFISFKAETTATLAQTYESLVKFAQNNGWAPREQDVSVGVTFSEQRFDLVPAKMQSGYQNWHSLYRRKSGSWTQTNIVEQIRFVRASGRSREIRALKIWRSLHNLDLPSFYLELAIIHALSGRSQLTLAANVLVSLGWIEKNFSSARLVDPANTNNVVSDGLTISEKRAIAKQAGESKVKPRWDGIIW